MYVECLANFFTQCVWINLRNENIDKYKEELLLLKRALTKIEKRKEMYEKLVLYFVSDTNNRISSALFINLCITEFFNKYSIDSSHSFEIFDRILWVTLDQWLSFVYTYHAQNVVNETKHPHMLICKTQFIRILSIEIDHLTSLMIGNEIQINDKLNKLNEINKHLKSELNDIVSSTAVVRKPVMVNKSIQTSPTSSLSTLSSALSTKSQRRGRYRC